MCCVRGDFTTYALLRIDGNVEGIAAPDPRRVTGTMVAMVTMVPMKQAKVKNVEIQRTRQPQVDAVVPNRQKTNPAQSSFPIVVHFISRIVIQSVMTSMHVARCATSRSCRVQAPSSSCRMLTHVSARFLARQTRCSAAKTSSTVEVDKGLAIMQWTGSDDQVAALDSLKRAFSSSAYVSEVTDEQLRWFLLDRKLDVEAAKEKLETMLEWRRAFGADAITTTDVAKEAATGKAYLHTQNDVFNRPVIVVRAANHVKDAAPLVESQRLCVYTLERALERLPEGQDTVLGIFDLRGFKNRNADMGFVKFMIDIFFTYYPKRLGQVLFVDAPWIFKPGWEVMKPWLKKYAALVRFVSADDVRKEYFTSETVPEDFAKEKFLGGVGRK